MQPVKTRLNPLRSRYFGVYPLGDGNFSAEVIHDCTGHVAGIYSTELEAARAYDDLCFELKGCISLHRGVK